MFDMKGLVVLVGVMTVGFLGAGYLDNSRHSDESVEKRIEAIEKENKDVQMKIFEHLDDITATQDEILEKLEEVPVKIQSFKRTFSNRHGAYKETPIIVWVWEGGSTVKADQLAQTIKAVQEQLSVIPKDSRMVDLLMETSAVESMRGLRVKQMRGGTARGLFQMEPSTEADTLRWLHSYFRPVYREVMHFYNNRMSAEWNRCFNVPYQAAMASIYYWRMCGDKMPELIASTEHRALVWKTFYNTRKGKGTVEDYVEKTEQLL